MVIGKNILLREIRAKSEAEVRDYTARRLFITCVDCFIFIYFFHTWSDVKKWALVCR